MISFCDINIIYATTGNLLNYTYLKLQVFYYWIDWLKKSLHVCTYVCMLFICIQISLNDNTDCWAHAKHVD